MSDLISRQAAMDGTKKIPDLNVYAYCSFLDMLSKLPSAEPKDYECWGCNCQKMKAQLSEEDATKGTTFDYIERQAAIDELSHMMDIDGFRDGYAVSRANVDCMLRSLPPAKKRELSCDGCKFCGQFEYQFPCKVCIRREKDYYARVD